MCLGRLRNFLSTILVSTFLMRCIRNVADIETLTDEILLLKKSVCIVRVETLDVSFPSQQAIQVFEKTCYCGMLHIPGERLRIIRQRNQGSPP